MARRRRGQGLPWRWGPVGRVPEPASPDEARIVLRAVRTRADPDALFLWLCQLRRAPYSYDWIDNFGRRSPREPDPALRALEAGQTVMTIFTLESFVPGRALRIRMKPGWPTRLFGAIDVEYRIDPAAEGARLIARMRMPRLPGPLGGVHRWALAWGDLLMMRKQLRTLAALAERTSGSG